MPSTKLDSKRYRYNAITNQKLRGLLEIDLPKCLKNVLAKDKCIFDKDLQGQIVDYHDLCSRGKMTIPKSIEFSKFLQEILLKAENLNFCQVKIDGYCAALCNFVQYQVSFTHIDW